MKELKIDSIYSVNKDTVTANRIKEILEIDRQYRKNKLFGLFTTAMGGLSIIEGSIFIITSDDEDDTGESIGIAFLLHGSAVSGTSLPIHKTKRKRMEERDALIKELKSNENKFQQ